MKITRQLLLATLLVLATGTGLYAQEVIAEDDASNYTAAEFEAGENMGTGFGEWNRIINGEDAAITLQTAADNGENSAVIDTDGMSFVLRASASDASDQRVDLGRAFAAALEDGQTLNFKMAWNWASPGLTGFTLHNGGWDTEAVMRLDFDQAGYFVNGDSVEAHASTADWDEGDQWRQGGVALDVSITQNGANLDYTVVAITEQSHVDFSGTVEGVTADRINFFNDGRPNWSDTGQGSLFVNSFSIVEGGAVSNEREDVARTFALAQNYPNPFNPTTNISFTLEHASNVELTVYDALGREIRTLQQGMKSAGQHTSTFDASELNSGIYLYRLKTEAGTFTRKMMLIK
ncbi:T9SS type A sorting domain-containing protein [Gracilimonas mengyeensis]|uniref:Por secretion system C-terminal sorting domain-containing protein n=1 Tax=Gracilimonas mengyeensis TaxID=1302730 RepID=A0A521BSE2_9BACT|nr:T9SS type A sorting domain-containing protein [Gracilimonas mengyeensis]SMO50092.1 Por secretion system C-terminal sorting domain-containing protein [Gracilimonas mengyeensis]